MKVSTPKPKPNYELTGVLAGGKVVSSRGSNKPPQEPGMVKWGKERGALFVLRYMPSKKGWRALDIRNASYFTQSRRGGGGSFPVVQGAVRGTRIWPTVDAAVMFLMAIGPNTQLELF